MQLLCQYPIQEPAVAAHIGRPIGALLPDGDVCFGIVERIHDGHLVMRPLENVPAAAVASMRKTLKSNPRVQQLQAASHRTEKADIKAWGAPYRYGWGYGNYGWGAGWWWLFPLAAIAALFAFPFFW